MDNVCVMFKIYQMVIIYLSICLSLYFSGVLKLAALILAFLLAVFLAFQLLEINMDFKLSSMICEYSVVVKETRHLFIRLF